MQLASDFTPIWVNDYLLDFLKCSKSDIIGKCWFHHVPENELDRVKERLAHRENTRQPGYSQNNVWQPILYGRQKKRLVKWLNNPIVDDENNIVEYRVTGQPYHM